MYFMEVHRCIENKCQIDRERYRFNLGCSDTRKKCETSSTKSWLHATRTAHAHTLHSGDYYNLRLYRRALQLARSWEAIEAEQTAIERAYIREEATRLFRKNHHVEYGHRYMTFREVIYLWYGSKFWPPFVAWYVEHKFNKYFAFEGRKYILYWKMWSGSLPKMEGR